MGAFDEWLASMLGDGRVELRKSTAQLVAEAHAEAGEHIEGRFRNCG